MKYIGKINENSVNFNGRNLVFNRNGYKVFLAETFEQCEGFSDELVMCKERKYFDLFNQSGYLYFVFKNDLFYLTFRISRKEESDIDYERDDYEVDYNNNATADNSVYGIIYNGSSTSDYDDDMRFLHRMEYNDPYLLKIILNVQKSYDLENVMKKVNGTSSKIIKEFWEWSKNSYGQDKSNKDAQNSIVNFNTQHGYGEEGQWARTSDGDVYIEEIIDGHYTGFDKQGKEKEGSIKDIIRTLTKGEMLDD